MNTTEQPAVVGPLDRPVRTLVDRLRDAAHAWENHLTICGDYMPSPAMLRAAAAEIDGLRATLAKARAGLSNGLWDYGPGQDEHEQCNDLIAEIDAVLRPNV